MKVTYNDITYNDTTYKYVAITTISIILGLLRILGFKHEALQAIDHLWIGGLIVYSVMSKDRFSMWVIILLSVLEVVCFIFVK
jgi:hypothetical protein